MAGSADTMDLLFPQVLPDLSEEQLAGAYAWPQGGAVRFNFVAGVDGGATVAGVSGPLGTSADHRVFELLRRTADVILVGAGTVRTEGYGGALISPESAMRRAAEDLPDHPAVAYVSGRLDLAPDSAALASLPVRPLIFTTERADPGRRRALDEVADVVTAGETAVDPALVVERLSESGHRRILCEGGPTLLGSFQAARAVDELCLSLAPLLTAGSGPRISAGAPEVLQRMKLHTLIRAADMLLLRYGRS